MAKLPHRPNRRRLEKVSPCIRRLAIGSVLHRVYMQGGQYPTSWDEFRFSGPLSRFDHHVSNCERKVDGSALRGVLYAAEHVATALAEVYEGMGRSVNRKRNSPWIVSFRTKCELQLLDLTGSFGLRAGASGVLNSCAHTYAQNWSRGFYEVYRGIEGLYYQSSLTNKIAVMLYERSRRKVACSELLLHTALSEPSYSDDLKEAVAEIGYHVR